MGARLLSVKHVAERLDVKPVTVRRLIRSGQLAKAWVGGKLTVPEDSLDAYVVRITSPRDLATRRNARTVRGSKEAASTATDHQGVHRIVDIAGLLNGPRNGTTPSVRG